MCQATEIRRHQEGNKTRAKHPEGHDIRDLRTEFAQKQRSISEHRDEEDVPSSWDPQRPPKDANKTWVKDIYICSLVLRKLMNMLSSS